MNIAIGLLVPLAQLVEHATFNRGVLSSNLRWHINKEKIMKKKDTEFARFKRAMARMEAENKKDIAALKAFKNAGKEKRK